MLYYRGLMALGSRSTGLGKMVQEPRAGFHVAKWRMFCHSAWLQISPVRFKQVYSGSANYGAYLSVEPTCDQRSVLCMLCDFTAGPLMALGEIVEETADSLIL